MFFKKLTETAKTPTYATAWSSGADLYADEDVSIGAVSSWRGVKTGIAIELPRGFEAQVRPRSGLALKHGVTVLNAPGTIDCFSNESVISTEHGKKTVNDIRLGEVVYSFNEKTFQFERDVVVALIDIGKRDVIVIDLEDSTHLEVTPNTLIYTQRGLVRALDITEDDEICVDHDI